MKKSTLITTIAMIVVVVVALSTATYAWFTNGTDTQVTDTISTQQASGWFLYGANFSEPKATDPIGQRNVTYSATSTLALHMLNAGLYSPNGALNTTLTQSSDLVYSYVDTKFFSAEQQGFGIVSEADIKTSASYTHTIANTSDTADNLNAIRIVNNNQTNDHCHLTILVNLGASAATTQYVAGKKFRVFIVTDRAENNVFNTEYYYGTDNGSTAGIGNGGSVVPASSGACVLTYSQDAQEFTILTGSTPTQGYSSATAGQKFGDTALTTGDKYYTIDIDLGVVNAYTALNLVFYAWFDGWALDNTAAGGDISVVFSVASSATAVAVPA